MNRNSYIIYYFKFFIKILSLIFIINGIFSDPSGSLQRPGPSATAPSVALAKRVLKLKKTLTHRPWWAQEQFFSENISVSIGNRTWDSTRSHLSNNELAWLYNSVSQRGMYELQRSKIIIFWGGSIRKWYCIISSPI